MNSESPTESAKSDFSEAFQVSIIACTFVLSSVDQDQYDSGGRRPQPATSTSPAATSAAHNTACLIPDAFKCASSWRVGNDGLRIAIRLSSCYLFHPQGRARLAIAPEAGTRNRPKNTGF